MGEDTEVTRSLLPQKISVFSNVVRLLKTDAKIFAMLDENAAAIEEAGNELVDTNADRALRSEQLAAILLKLAEREGPVRAALNKAAARVQEAGDEKQQRAAVGKEARAFIRDIDALIKSTGIKMSSLAPRADIDLDTPKGRAQQTAELMQKADEWKPPPIPIPPPPSPNRLVLSTGAKLWSGSGREMSPVPKIDTLNERKTKASLERIDAWLMKEALAESVNEDKDFVKQLVSTLDPKRITPADRDMLNLIIFDDAEGATEANLSPMTAANMNHPPTAAQIALANHPLVLEAEEALRNRAATEQIETIARDTVAAAHEALARSGTPLDQAADRVVSEVIEPMVEAAFPKAFRELDNLTEEESPGNREAAR